MDQPFVVFLIGMRVNQFWAVQKWVWVARQMGNMLQVLYSHPEKGFLGGESFFNVMPFSTILVSYWRSFDHLERFARDQQDPHLAAWREFYKRVGTSGDVGIWHETYTIEPQQYEGVYANMPLFGLAAASGKAIPVKGSYRDKARGRLQGKAVALAPELEMEEHA
jgi:hypothetical protein